MTEVTCCFYNKINTRRGLTSSDCRCLHRRERRPIPKRLWSLLRTRGERRPAEARARRRVPRQASPSHLFTGDGLAGSRTPGITYFLQSTKGTVPFTDNLATQPPAKKAAKMGPGETEEDRRAAREVENILAGNPVEIPGLDELVGTHESEYIGPKMSNCRFYTRCRRFQTKIRLMLEVIGIPNCNMRSSSC